MLVPYYQVNPYIVNSVRSYYSNLAQVYPMITFEEYVKSQLHFNIVGALYDRQLVVYKKCYEFMQGLPTGCDEYIKVLFWYYEDINKYVVADIKNILKVEDFSIINTNVPKLDMVTSEILDLKDIYNDLVCILETGNANFKLSTINYFSFLDQFPAQLRMTLKPSKLLAEAVASYKMSKDKILYKLNW